jgi:hypothetical protein
MFRRSQLIVAAALALVCSLPASTAVAQQQVRSHHTRDADAGSERQVPPPPSSIAASEGQRYEAERYQGPPGVYTDREREMNRHFQSTPEYKRIVLQARLDRLQREAATATAVPSSGFDWGDAGIGAAGMLGLSTIAAGSTLFITSRRRRRGFQVAAR